MLPDNLSHSSKPNLITRLINWFGGQQHKLDDTTPIDPGGAGDRDDGVIGEPFGITFPGNQTAITVRVKPTIAPAHALSALRLPDYKGILVVHGGAGQMSREYMAATRQFMIQSIAPFAEQNRLLVVGGGTQAGTSQILGESREAIGGTYPLIGVVPEGSITYPDAPPSNREQAPLNPTHSHFLFVAGQEFGTESDLLVGLLRAAGQPGVAFVINGGDIVRQEVTMHMTLGSPVVAVQGSGRTADELADPASAIRHNLPNQDHLHIVPIDDPPACTNLLARLMPRQSAPR